MRKFFIASLLITGFIFIVAPVLAQQYTNSQRGADSVTEFFKIFFPVSDGNSRSTSNSSTNAVSQIKQAVNEVRSVKSLRELFSEIESKTKVPARIIEGVMLVESPSLLASLTEEEVSVFSQPGASLPSCQPNVCSAAGPMQMTTGIDNKGSSTCSECGLSQCPNAWAGYGNSVNEYGGYSHQSNPCNLRDNVYAAAAKIKKDSGNTGGAWTQDQVSRAAERYYGSCSDRYRYQRLGNRTYCEFLWWYYSGQ